MRIVVKIACDILKKIYFKPHLVWKRTRQEPINARKESDPSTEAMCGRSEEKRLRERMMR
jgi:hypothetical protein